LFLTSCFEYILAGIVLNAGRPFRQRPIHNCRNPLGIPLRFLELTALTGPFIATIAVTLLITLYMVLFPSHWVMKQMQLTKISWDFKLLVVFLGLCYLAIAWFGEHYIFQRLAKFIGHAKQTLTKRSKKRKEYKLIQEQMRY
jgi:cation-transporting P-type ATPase 13A2